jgi:uncharacterized protein (TIGR00255 family)
MKRMIKSMTGFGRSEQKINGREISVEIKSVNHRYFEFNCKTSRGYAFLEEKLKAYVQQRVSRGKIDLYVSVVCAEETQANVTLNHSLAAGYVEALKEIAAAYGVQDDISVSSVARFTDIFTVHKAQEDEDEVWQSVLPVLDSAMESFMNMRRAEGARMKEDVLGRSKTILSIVEQIDEQSPQTVAQYREKLEERLRELLESASVDEQRLLTEAAIFADKTAVAEETVRLRSHFSQLERFMEAGEPVGRKIDFILQEMNREANTIGSKVQNAPLAHLVVEIKSELEKIREQIQNIE